MRLALAIPLVILAGAGTATLRVQDMAGRAAAQPAAPSSRLSASIEDELAQRQARLNQQARALDLKEKMIAATAGRMTADIAAPPAVSTTESSARAGERRLVKRAADERILQVARVYQAMKPREAAAVFERLDPALQVQIALQMRERSVASVMAAMSPQAASALTAALAGAVVAQPPAGSVKSDGRLLPESAPALALPGQADSLRPAARPVGA